MSVTDGAGQVWCAALQVDMEIKALNGVRGLAAYIVVFSHYANYTSLGRQFFPTGTGQIGVMLFFVLSGFLMGMLYLHRDASASSAGDFALRRIARVVPLYLVVVAVSYAALRVDFGIRAFEVTDGNLWQHLLFIKGEHALWTIAAEMQFYVMFAAFWLLTNRIREARPLLLVFCIALLIFARFPSAPEGLAVAHFFAAGVLVSLLPRQAFQSWSFPVATVLFIGAFPAMQELLFGQRVGLWGNPMYLLATTLFVTSCIHNPLADKLLGSVPMAFLGSISYSVYLWHVPVMWTLGEWTDMKQWGVLGLALFLVITTIVATASYRLIELPCQGFLLKRHRLRSAAARP